MQTKYDNKYTNSVIEEAIEEAIEEVTLERRKECTHTKRTSYRGYDRRNDKRLTASDTDRYRAR